MEGAREGGILLLTDGKAGHENQSKAFARALGLPYEVLPVRFRSGAEKMLSYAFDHIGVRTVSLLDAASAEALRNACAGHPAVVVGTGSGTFYAAKAAAKLAGAKCGVALYPRGYHLPSFDCILAPSFDNPAPAPNVVEIPANLVAADEAFYRAGAEALAARHPAAAAMMAGGAARDAVAVVIGGPNKCASMTEDWMRRRLDELFAKETDSGRLSREMWVTTSRRTPPGVEAVVDSYPWTYRLIYSRDRFNPIPGFVALAKTLYVTAESTGMLSEACTSGSATVHALDNLKPGPSKFRRFAESLARDGYLEGSRKVDLSRQFARARSLLLP